MSIKNYVGFTSRETGNGKNSSNRIGKREFKSIISSTGLKRLNKQKADRIERKFLDWFQKMDAQHKLL